MTAYRSIITVLCLVLFALLTLAPPADAQKKTAKKKATQVQQQAQPDEEESTPVTAPTPNTPPPANTFKAMLKQYVGEKTNLGTFKKLADDYVVFEDEGVTAMYPIHAIQSAKLIKDDDTSPARLEFKLIAKD